jgi:hypothetical protein
MVIKKKKRHYLIKREVGIKIRWIHGPLYWSCPWLAGWYYIYEGLGLVMTYKYLIYFLKFGPKYHAMNERPTIWNFSCKCVHILWLLFRWSILEFIINKAMN